VSASSPSVAEQAQQTLTSVDVLPILLVDDRPENLRVLLEVLAPLGYPIQTAASGREALRLLLDHDFGLILLDVRMPGLDGLETAQMIKGRPRNRDTPIVFLTAARDELGDVIRGYGAGAVDYVLKPVDPEVLRSKVAVFAELERGRRALQRSEGFLRAAFEAAPIGKTILDAQMRIVRSNPAFARMVGREALGLRTVAVAELVHPDDRAALDRALGAARRTEPGALVESDVDLRLLDAHGTELWVALVTSSIESLEEGDTMLLAQWVDLSARRRAEQARAELLVEQAARTHAEDLAAHLTRLQEFSGAIESLSLEPLLAEIARRVREMFDAQCAEVRLERADEQPIEIRVTGEKTELNPIDDARSIGGEWVQMPLRIEGVPVGLLRVGLARGRSLTASDQSLLFDMAERAALSIRRAQLHEQEHRIAVELQRGLLPKELPVLEGLELAAHYQAAGLGTEAGGDWYDAFVLAGGSLGVVVGDVAGRGVTAASTMGQLRSVTRAFAVAGEGERTPGEVLTRLNRHQLALGQEELFTVIYAIFDARSGTVAWANAGHPPPLLRTAGGETRYLEGGEGLTGIEEVIYEEQRLAVGSGDTVVFYTDGLVERRGESLDTGLDRLRAAVREGPTEPRELCEHILRATLPPAAELHDDVTALIVRIS